MRVLIAEDEPRLAAFLVEALEEVGWQPDICSSGSAALELLRIGSYDVVVLDWVLPGLTGPQVVSALRAGGDDVPVLLLTARGDVRDRVEGLDAGADDYLAKPFDLDELLARLRALDRRRRRGTTSTHRVGDLLVDTASRTASRGGVPIFLSPRELDILVLLVRRAGRVVSRYDILEAVWDGDTDLRSNVIDVHVASLRAKVDRAFGRRSITTARGAGYRLDPDDG